MNTRKKKSKNAGNKKRKNNLSGRSVDFNDSLPVVVEKEVVMAVRSAIKRGEEDLFKDVYGMAGLEDYLVGVEFEELADETYYQVGRKYYQKSCDKGHPLGQFAVALTYLKGSLGQSFDESLAVNMMSLAAKSGCGPALYNKGMWLMKGTFQQQKNAKKAHKLYHRAIKDPAIKEFPQELAGSFVSLAKLRMSGEGCSKSYASALNYFRAAEEVDPSEYIRKAIQQTELLVSIGGVELQREADTRNRRLKVLARAVQYQSLADWVALYKHCGFDFSVQSGMKEAENCLDHHGFVGWIERSGAVQTLPDEYPAMLDALPSLECTGCSVTEDTTGEKMKKCTDCQAPYCGVKCQRQDWVRHKPVCEAVQGNMGGNLTHHEIELSKQDENLAEKLGKMGISMEDFDEVTSSFEECGHSESSIPCSTECYQEKGASSMNKHRYTLVGQSSVVTERQRQNASVPQDIGHAPRVPNRKEERNIATKITPGEDSGKNNSQALCKQLAMLEEDPDLIYCLFTPANVAGHLGIQRTSFIGDMMFNMMWNRLVSLPWGAGAGSKALRIVYNVLESNVGGSKYKTMLRTQLMAEFGADPLECK